MREMILYDTKVQIPAIIIIIYGLYTTTVIKDIVNERECTCVKVGNAQEIVPN